MLVPCKRFKASLNITNWLPPRPLFVTWKNSSAENSTALLISLPSNFACISFEIAKIQISLSKIVARPIFTAGRIVVFKTSPFEFETYSMTLTSPGLRANKGFSILAISSRK